MNVPTTVFVIDEDPVSRKFVCTAARAMGLESKCYASTQQFFDEYASVPCGCIVTTYESTNDMEFMDELEHRDIELPVIVSASHPPTALTVQVMKHGAISVLERPYQRVALRQALNEAIQRSDEDRVKRVHRHALRGRIASLSEQERKVMDLMIRGLANKVIAKKLNVSLRTVESRRHEVFTKMQVKTVAELVRVVTQSMQ